MNRSINASRRFFGYVLACCVLGLSAPVSAYYSPLAFIPAQPVAGAPIAVRVGFGICDALVVANSQDRTLTVQGSILRVTAIGVEAPDLVFCNYPEYGYADFEIGPLGAGNYTIEVYVADLFDPTRVRFVRTAPLVVGQAPALPVPSVSWFGSILLCLAAGFAGASRVRSRHA